MRIAIPLAAALLALAVLPGRTTVLGHAAPERFEPSPGQVLDAPPSRVDGWFTQDIRRQEDMSFIQVYRINADGSRGDRVDSGQSVVDDNDRRHMFVALGGGAGPGEYAVAWQTLSDEDDEADGACYRFFVGQAAADAAHTARGRLDVAGDCPTSAVSAPPEAQAKIELTAPEESDSGDVAVNLSSDATIRLPTGEGRDPKFAHYHLYLDIAPLLLHSHPASGDGMGQMATATPDYSKDIMTTENSYTFRGLKPGHHVVFAALFYDDHTPFDPPVIAAATFRVGGSEGGGGGIGTGAVIGIAVAAGLAGLLLGGAAVRAVRRR